MKNSEVYKDYQVCTECKHKYIRIREKPSQLPAEIDYDICPYCHTVNGFSNQWEFYSDKLEDA